MAESAVSFAVSKLANLIVQEIIDLRGVRDEVERLVRNLQQIQAILRDADEKKNNYTMNKIWVRTMRDVAFEAEDFIDSYMDFKLRRQQEHGRVGFMKRCMFRRDELIHRHKFLVNIRRIRAKILDLFESGLSHGILDRGQTTGTNNQFGSQNVIPISPQLHDDIDIVGFDDVKKNIVQKLVDISNKNQYIISIVGMGGLGKTALANSIYNDPKVKKSFDILAWVTISQEYAINEIMKRILSLIPESSIEQLSDSPPSLADNLCEQLKKCKYLIILDDVWEENVWDQLIYYFPDVQNGSRVMITTCKFSVAKIADAMGQCHELRFLTEEESWELFMHNAFPGQDTKTCCPIDLVDSARELVKRCGGLPLALVVSGRLLSIKLESEDARETVIESMKRLFVEDGVGVLDALALSYYDLPYHLKLCFFYFGCFREDMDIPAKTLIKLWSAEGVLPTRYNKTMEEVGIDCLEELKQRCMIQVTKSKYDNSAKYCRIHGLLHYICILEAKDRRFLEIYKDDNADCGIRSNGARHLIIFNHVETLNYSNSNVQGLFYGEHNPLTFKALKGQLGGFKLLKVLYLNSLDMSEFPSEIKSLIHLRYLELHSDNVEEIPSWIGHLCNLQTFIIRSKILEMISDSLWRIESLRHVDILASSSAAIPNMGNTVLKHLKTLKGVTAGSWIGNTLPNLTNLSKLNICEISDDHAIALSSSIQKLVKLVSLKIEGDEIPLENIITAFSNQHHLRKLHLDGKLNCKQLPHNDVFPQQLVKLVLLYSELEHDPMATLEKLTCLKHLELGDDSYGGKQMICSATGFPELLSLSIRCCDELEEWKIEEGAMPCLKSLQLCYCPKLMVIPEVLKHVPLDQLVLKHMPGNWYNIRHVHNISF